MQQLLNKITKAKLLAKTISIKLLKRKPFPLYVNLIINSRCNLKCSYCYGQYPMRKTPDWSLAKVKQVVDELARRGTGYIVVHGGETLLHEDIDAVIEYINQKKILVAVVTNGQLPEKLKAMKHFSKLDFLAFSLDGNRIANNIVRGAGTFEKIMESIAIAQKYHKVPIRINSAITKHAIADFEFLAEFAKKNGFRWGINFLFNPENPATSQLSPTQEQVIEFLDKLIAYKQRGYPINSPLKILKYVKNWYLNYPKKYLTNAEASQYGLDSFIQCRHGDFQIVIDESGNVFPCNMLQGEFKAKNIFDSFDEALAWAATQKQCYTCAAPSMMHASDVINLDVGVIVDSIKGA